ncbi:hypothetical protein C8A01DRAFT_34992 [Parachaetomium inaequale]|uniref:Uncharacterized protein n=1 Tax=Parachaetomium inaequale TaxID=2588326 RepID=A0AAN6PKW2_9PEZI|nr:hypothetical protein C8A01DRAFT_34992 [Parachaetomium inaequale]
MQLRTALAFLAATVAAMQTEPQSKEVDFVVRRDSWKRASCAVELPNGRVQLSTAPIPTMFALDQPECVCKCHYG